MNISGQVASGENDDEITMIFDSQLATLSFEQRMTLTVFVIFLGILSITGNIGSLYANKRRKLRIFYRYCQISLALSDLILTVCLATLYLTQFGAPSVQIWCLGDLMCRLIPFITTGAILVSSMTLLGIAFDRYLAIKKTVVGFWNPTGGVCIFFAMATWGLSYAIAAPMFAAYNTFEVYIMTSGTVKEDDSAMIEGGLAKLCVSEKESNACYYVVVLAIIFVPTLVAFVWLNSIIANKLWIQRHSIRVGVAPSSPSPQSQTSADAAAAAAAAAGGSVPAVESSSDATSCDSRGFRPTTEEKQMDVVQQPYHRCQGCNKICTSSLMVPASLAASTLTITTTMTATSRTRTNSFKNNSNVVAVGSKGNNAKHISSREARHLRMFTIVLILMAVFILFRLPAWIFLIMRMYGTYTLPIHWILHFAFGVLTLTSCALNPLLYTFLAETIQYAMFVKGKFCGLKRYFQNCYGGMGCLWCDSSSNDDKDNEKMSHNQNENQNSHQNANPNNGNPKGGNNGCDSYNGYNDDGRSYVGAKGTSRKSDDDSEVYTIIPVQRVVM